ncbi:MAG TPA: hypothetical protein PKY29_06015 [Ferruginibacter sp.]|nr:hypothetical protein [Ferruginibacter sp.]HRN79813.1 hypothetical protein [Ferruginibacter sp.]HRO17687.1 hypothetical protein [Ferruginibacter sp.]HRQ20852.1 hypothetical protein [Ferruginibacter sp.]
MKNVWICLAIFLLTACNSNDNAYPETAMDTGRTFIRASLDGDFKEAERLLLPETENREMFNSYMRYYQKMPGETKANYKKASFEINEFLELNDSTTIINYSNSYMNKPMEIKVVRSNNRWQVDFTYTTSGNLPIH